MALTVDEVSKITTDLILGRPLRVKGKEADAMAAKLKTQINHIREMGYTPMPIREIPEPDEPEEPEESDEPEDNQESWPD